MPPRGPFKDSIFFHILAAFLGLDSLSLKNEESFVKPRRLKHRKRALSQLYITSTTLNLRSIADPQLSSGLFLLPSELRDQIWQHCLGGLEILFKLKDGCLRGWTWWDEKHWKKCDLLALPLSCRRIYLETIDTMYSQNTIRVRMTECVLYLDRVLLPQRINSIRCLDFQWYVGEPPVDGSSNHKDWCRVWHTIASMENLTEVRIEIFTAIRLKQSWSREEFRLLEDAKQVTRPQSFKLNLVWPQGPTAIQLLCQVTRSDIPF